MKKEQITLWQGIAMMTMFIMGSTMVVGGLNEAEKDSWLALLVGILLALPVLLIYARLKKLLPDMDLYDMLQWAMGRIVGKVFVLLFAWYAFHLGSLVIRNFTEFIASMALPSTPQLVAAGMLGSVCIWGVRSGLRTMGSWSIVFAVLVIFVVLITALSGMQQYDINNIKPIAEKGMGTLFKGATSVFSFPFAETVIFLLGLGTVAEGKSPYRMWTLALLIGGFVLFIASLRNLLILGEQIYIGRYYSSYTAAMVITLGDFLSRFEIIIGTNFLLCGFVKVTMCLHAASVGAAKFFKVTNYKSLAAPIGLLMILFSYIVYQDMTEMFDWLPTYKYYAFPFQVILPVIVWIVVEIKLKVNTAIIRYREEAQPDAQP